MSDKKHKKKQEHNEEETTNSQNELKECQDKYLRLLAEMENARKRMQKEKQETISFAIENTICEFLPIIDNFENALKFAQSSSEEVKNWATGFQMILSQLRDVLYNHGVVAFHSEGNTFDPHFHEAMEIVETSEYPDGSIIEEFAKGYKSATRTIRPAKVKVTRLPAEEEIETIEELENIEEKLLKEPLENSMQEEKAEGEEELNNKKDEVIYE